LDTMLILAPGNYYIGTTQQPNIGADSIYFGLDANTNGNLSHFFYNVDGNWIPSNINASVMMRPLMSTNFVPTSITNIPQKIQASIYPNPCTNTLNIESKDAITSYAIYNTQGCIVQQENTNCNTISVANLISGNYFLQINNSKTIAFTKQ
jgi:hypothetical protein